MRPRLRPCGRRAILAVAVVLPPTPAAAARAGRSHRPLSKDVGVKPKPGGNGCINVKAARRKCACPNARDRQAAPVSGAAYIGTKPPGRHGPHVAVAVYRHTRMTGLEWSGFEAAGA